MRYEGDLAFLSGRMIEGYVLFLDPGWHRKRRIMPGLNRESVVDGVLVRGPTNRYDCRFSTLKEV
jgi:hypothetical protein